MGKPRHAGASNSEGSYQTITVVRICRRDTYKKSHVSRFLLFKSTQSVIKSSKLARLHLFTGNHIVATTGCFVFSTIKACVSGVIGGEIILTGLLLYRMIMPRLRDRTQSCLQLRRSPAFWSALRFIDNLWLVYRKILPEAPKHVYGY